MKLIRLILSSALTVVLVLALNRSITIGALTIPPLGKFLDPFHGFWQNSYEHPRDIRVSGTAGIVHVAFDTLGIPHIFADNELDLIKAQGYITALDRLWQMEFQTLAGAGRISEILGAGPNNAILDFDRSQRRIGMVAGAQQFMKAVEADPEVQALVTAYTQGVNQYIETLSYGQLPFEYKLLDYAPEPWTEFKVALLLKSMAKTLNIGDKDIEMTNALNLLGKEKLELLFPDYEAVGDPIVEKNGKWGFDPVKLDTVALAVPKELIALNQAVEKTEEGIGSNNWAVHGTKTATGAPILCSDPHLTLSHPSIWYAIHLNCPTMNVMGVSLPGAPGVTIGFNDSIAWGMTNAQRDLVDWYKIEWRDASRNEYRSDGQWRKSTKVVETFAVKGSAPFYDTIVFTHHGPVTYDQHFKADNERNQMAFRWVSHDASNEARTLLMAGKAKNVSEFNEALKHYASPAQNFVFASVQGDIQMRIQGKFPVRRKNEGRFVMDGTSTRNEWLAFIPFEHGVYELNPSRGFVSSANQLHADPSYPYYITASSYEAYRNRRINNLLREMQNITPAQMMNMQGDNFSLKGQEFLSLAIKEVMGTQPNKKASEILNTLSAWDFMNDPDAAAPVYFETWWRWTYNFLWDELNSSPVDLPRPTAFNSIKLLTNPPEGFGYFDVQGTEAIETRSQLLKLSLDSAINEVAQWEAKKGEKATWGPFKGTYIEHLTRVQPLSSFALNGGNRESINASQRRAGPSWRMVVSLEKTGVKAWAVYPGGQSGNPGSKFYDNYVDPWRDNRHLALTFTPAFESYTANTIRTVTFTPSK